MLLQRVSRIIDQHGLVSPEDTVIIGVSGGSDSMALLHILAEIRPSLHCIAVYVDHGLRPNETEEEIITVRSAALRLGAVFHNETADVGEYAAIKGCSLEEAARTLRYRIFERLRRQYTAVAIAVAHTADDQVEEFFVRLCRGSGLKGLSGMAVRNGSIIRPLLHEKKQTLRAYLEGKNISCCFDSSNDDRRFLRNRVRLDLLPELEQHFNPAIRQTVLQTMDILRQEDDLLHDLTEKVLQSIHQLQSSDTPAISQQREISLTLLKAEHPALQRRILEKLCWQMNCRPGFRQIELLLGLITAENHGGEVHLEGGLRVHTTAATLVFSYPAGRWRFRGSGRQSVSIDQEIAAPGIYPIAELGMILSLSFTQSSGIELSASRDCLYLDAEKISFPLRLRSIQEGQRFKPFGAQGRRKLLRFLSDRKIPARERHMFPTLLSENRPICIPSLEIADDFRLTAATEKVLMVSWCRLPAEEQPTAGDIL